jgi:hypothetical protein
MKRLLISVLICIIFTGCLKTIKLDTPKLDNRYPVYKEATFKSVDRGWAPIVAVVTNKRYIAKHDPEEDNSWYQGFYVSFLALDYYHFKDPNTLRKIKDFLEGTVGMLQDTGWIFLRDNSIKSVSDYKGGNTRLEASKDQILGLMAGILMIYYYVNDQYCKDIINTICSTFYPKLVEYGYMLYNEKAKRFYNSAYYPIIHYAGIEAAFDYILVGDVSYRLEDPIYQASYNISFKLLIYRRGIIEKDIRIGDINILQIEELKDEDWYKELLQADEFAVNLAFYEFLIMSTVDKTLAKKILKILEHKEVMKLRHLNLAALYLYILRKWGIDGNQVDYYKKVLTRDNFLYSYPITPNSFRWGSSWYEDTVNGFIIRPCGLNFPDTWGQPSGYTDKTMADLEAESRYKKIDIDTGVMFMMRRLLGGF